MGLQVAEYSTFLREARISVSNVVADIEERLVQLANAPLPAEGIRAFFATIRAEVTAQAEAIAAARAKMAGGPGTAGAANDPEYEALLASASKRFQKLAEMASSERDLLLAAHAQRLADLETYAVLTGLAEEEERRIREELELQHQAKLGDIAAQGVLARRQFEALNVQQQSAFVFGELEALTRGVAQQNRVMFNINKVAAIANAIIGAHEGASKTLASYPWPLAPVLAALHYAAGLARVQAIRSASFGGSSAPSVGGGTATPVTPAEPVTPAPPVTTGGATSQPQVTVIIEGNVIADDQWIDDVLLPGIQDAVNNRDRVLFSTNSRQARDLVAA
jgi:hypothetical protein